MQDQIVALAVHMNLATHIAETSNHLKMFFQVRICYVDQGKDKKERNRELRSIWYFECDCHICHDS